MNSTEMKACITMVAVLNDCKVYAHHITAFPAGNTHLQMGGGFGSEINSIQDFNGLRMRISGHAGGVVEQSWNEADKYPSR